MHLGNVETFNPFILGLVAEHSLLLANDNEIANMSDRERTEILDKFIVVDFDLQLDV